MISLAQIEYLLALDKTRNFSKAAELCFVTQPTLSQQIQKVEEDLGFAVFDRNKKPIAPTPLGQSVLAQARVVFDECSKLSHFSELQKDEVQGAFTLAVIPTLSPYIVPLFVAAFSHLYPKVDLKIEEMQTKNVLEALNEDHIDAGLIATPETAKNLKRRILYYEPFYLLVSKEHPLSKKNLIKEDDIDGSDLWLLNDGHCFREQILKVCSLRKHISVFKNIQFESGQIQTLIQLVSKAGGYTLLPAMASSQHLNKNLKLVPFAAPQPSREVSLIFRRSSYKGKILGALEKTIMDHLPEENIIIKKNSKIDVIN